jgi:hypothetical protein
MWPYPIFGSPVYALLVLLLPETFQLFDFPIFRILATWWRLFQKRVMRTKFDIYDYIRSQDVTTNNIETVVMNKIFF